MLCMHFLCFLCLLHIQHINPADQAVDLFGGKDSLPHLISGCNEADRCAVRPVGMDNPLHAGILGNNLDRAGYHLRC